MPSVALQIMGSDSRRERRSRTGLALLLLVFSPLSVIAAPEPEGGAERDWEYRDYMEKPHRWMSRRLGDVSRQIDGIFATDDLYDEVSGTYGEIRVRNRFTELYEDELDIDFRLKLRVPNSKRRLKLIFESDTEERETSAGQIGSIGDSVVGEIRDENAENPGGRDGLSDIFAGIRQELVNRIGFKVDTDVGVKVRTPPKLFTRAKIRRNWEGELWSVRFKDTPYWFSDEGFGNKAEFDFDRRFSSRYAARLSLRHSWEEEDDVTRLINVLNFYRLVASRSSMSLGFAQYVDNEFSPFQTKAYSAAFTLRRRMYQEWLFVEATPHVVWARGVDYEPDYAFTMGFEILFGERYIDRALDELLPPGEGEARGGVLVRRFQDRHDADSRLADQLPELACRHDCMGSQGGLYPQVLKP